MLKLDFRLLQVMSHIPQPSIPYSIQHPKQFSYCSFTVKCPCAWLRKTNNSEWHPSSWPRTTNNLLL